MRAALCVLALALLAGCGAEGPPAASPQMNEARANEARANEIWARAARYLWARQARDGGWHSRTYGLLRSGQSLTPFVLDALLSVPVDLVPRDGNLVRRALAFIVSHVNPEGAVGLSDPAQVDYPNYATALALPLLRRNVGRETLPRRLCDRLLGQQFKRATGWSERHPAYGAWGMGGRALVPPHPGHLDLSMTRHVLEALVWEAGEEVREARARALRFVDRCRSSSGGYFFTTVMTEKNKAGPTKGYGTCTADAILALLAAGVEPKDERLAAAGQWLRRHHRVDRVPGLPEAEDEGWALSMRYYYLAASARALAALAIRDAPAGRDWRGDLVEALERAQRPNGSFVNTGALMKEDDPLLATALAIRALADAR